MRSLLLAALLFPLSALAGSPSLRLIDPDFHPSGPEALAQMPDNAAARSHAFADAILHGGLPPFLRQLTPVRFDAEDADGTVRRVEIHVTPDYLSVGTDASFVYAPLGLAAARRIARELDAVLPTPALADRIHAAAHKIEPTPIPPSQKMASKEVLLAHQEIVAPSLPAPGELVAGHKKDVVLTGKLASQPDRVAIYGWHHQDGTPIQPVSLWHGKRYVDYSHGVRLVSREVRIDGERYDLLEVLSDERLAPLVSGEPPLSSSLLASFDDDLRIDADELPWFEASVFASVASSDGR